MNVKRISVLLILLTLVLSIDVGLASARNEVPPWESVADMEEDVMSGRLARANTTTPSVPLACPANPAGLPESIERTKFCVYYSHNSITDAQAIWAADTVEMYWNRFVALGFGEPKYSGKLEVQLLDTTGCNGGTGWSANYITTYAGCFDPAEAPDYEAAQKVLGHELTHRLQYAHDSGATAPGQTKFLKEGTARATEDNWFAEIDCWPNALTAVSSSFNKQANSYLLNTNTDVTSYGQRYNSCLLWKYTSEQYGTVVVEPELGIDFFDQTYDQTTLGNFGVAAVNGALSTLGESDNFDEAFVNFAAANWAKDLVGTTSKLDYIDEDQACNPAPYGPIVPTNGGTIDTGGPSASWNNQSVDRYGIRYYEATPDSIANCPVVAASFHRDSGSTAFYHVFTQQGANLADHEQGSGADWSRAFLNDGITKIVAAVGSLNTSSQVDVEFSCPDPALKIKQPNQMAPEYVGAYNAADKFVVQVSVSSTVGVPIVSGLDTSDFQVEIGGYPAVILGGGFVEHQYFLQVQAPNPGANGPYDLEISLEESGTSTVIATDTETEAVLYDATDEDTALVIDRSGSMGWYTEPPIEAARDAAKLFIDIMNSSEGVAVVPFNHDVSPAAFGMQFATLPVRTSAKAYVDALTATGGTSIGDGMDEAEGQMVASPTGNSRCRYILLSDGQENQPLYWADVMADVVATGCPVMSIALGPGADETLLQQISQQTGGQYYYNDVYAGTSHALTAPDAFAASDMFLDLDSTYEYAQAWGRRQRFLAEKGEVGRQQVETHTVQIDGSVLEAVFVLDWFSQYYAIMELELVQPNGTVISSTTTPYDFSDAGSDYVGWRITNPEEGEWQLNVRLLTAEVAPVPYQVIVSGKTKLTARLFLPDTLGSRFFTGNIVPIYALVTSGDGPMSGTLVLADVTAPNGTESTTPLYDDGEHGDGDVDDGFYAGFYTLVNQAEEESPPVEDGYPNPTPKDEGSYRVRLRVGNLNGIYREALGAFAILEGDDDNSNGLPDPYEDEHNITDPSGDPDTDQLDNSDEYYAGTDPNNSDSDGGGENDWSEVILHGKDPLDPSDDEVEAPDYFQGEPIAGGDIVLTYDVKGEYVKMSAYRAASLTGPWQLHVNELPLTGIYSDIDITIGNSYVYRLVAIDGDNHWSWVLDSEEITSGLDPIPPAALVIINGGVITTAHLSATLSFAAYEGEGMEQFSDIAEMMISNDPALTGAGWQSFTQGISWTLEAGPGWVARVYAIFKDGADNESNIEVGQILYIPTRVYLPLVLRNL
ncbi:MAG: VWA domain-containing protein [Chloroflexi bacterium]|nr:VWA domain-containing protein [Chloroflexota bacterium]